MNLFIVVDIEMDGNQNHFERLKRNITKVFPEAKGEFTGFSHYLRGDFFVKKKEILEFLDEMKKFVYTDSQDDPDVSLIRYGEKILYVCCPHLQEDESTAAFFISGFNCLPEFVLEGSGLRYWGE